MGMFDRFKRKKAEAKPVDDADDGSLSELAGNLAEMRGDKVSMGGDAAKAPDGDRIANIVSAAKDVHITNYGSEGKALGAVESYRPSK